MRFRDDIYIYINLYCKKSIRTFLFDIENNSIGIEMYILFNYYLFSQKYIHIE